MDVTNMDSVREAITLYEPDVIIHAAGTKYVDLGETFPNECVDVNIRGSQNIARAAMEKKVGLVIGISTDKAAPPSKSIYGNTKSVMEKLYLLLDNKSDTRFFCLRFGNIAWSTGSVFPIWQTMLNTEGKILTTGMNMRRFYFTVHEASQMIVDSMDQRESIYGRLLAKKMKSVLIGDVLERFIHIYGGTYERVGQRAGECIDETMIAQSETPYSSRLDIGPNEYYLIDHTRDQNSGIDGPVNSDNAEKFTEKEIDRLIQPAFNSYI
jgi:FlaA1/EpsC-like NDP-sugar epimerase